MRIVLEQFEKKAKRPGRIDRDRKAVKSTRFKLKKLFKAYLAEKGKQVAAFVVGHLRKGDTPDGADDDLAARALALQLMIQLNLDWSDLPAQVSAILTPLMANSVQEAFDQLGGDLSAALALANPRAVSWAEDRAAEMVGMKYIDGTLVPNPDAKWRIDEIQRGAIQDLVVQAENEGWSNDRLAAAIEDDQQFSPARAEMIARTETAMADVQGNMVAYNAAQDSGIELDKEWITAGDDQVSEDCQANADQGPIPLNDVFQSGASAPPDHPNCRCDILPIRVEGEQGDASASDS